MCVYCLWNFSSSISRGTYKAEYYIVICLSCIKETKKTVNFLKKCHCNDSLNSFQGNTTWVAINSSQYNKTKTARQVTSNYSLRSIYRIVHFAIQFPNSNANVSFLTVGSVCSKLFVIAVK